MVTAYGDVGNYRQGTLLNENETQKYLIFLKHNKKEDRLWSCDFTFVCSYRNFAILHLLTHNRHKCARYINLEKKIKYWADPKLPKDDQRSVLRLEILNGKYLESKENDLFKEILSR